MNHIKINRRSGVLTISSVFLLLIAGGVVRSTGSGMGCPDWPKCYGAWLPPTCACQLPADYQDMYAAKRVEKAKRFAAVLHTIGFQKQANLILNDPNLHTPEVFNPVKAWTEYINRIIGVLSGFFSLLFFLSLLRIRRHVSKLKFWSGVAGFIMMLFNAWLGSIVVATNLFPVIISIHYLAAYAVLALFMFSLVNARIEGVNSALLPYKWYFTLLTIVSLIQVVYGTQLREVSDRAVALNTLFKNGISDFSALGSVFTTHWLLAISLVISALIPAILLRKKLEQKWFRLVLLIPITMGIQYVSGVLNLRFGFPMPAQVAHIFFAGIIFGITLYICIALFRAPKPSQKI